jgi:hypothetical protein
VLVPGAGGALSDSSGYFRIEGVPPGRQMLRVMAMFFERTEVGVDVVADSTTRVDVVMRKPPLEWPPAPTKTKRCEVHHKKMRVVSMSIGYGLRVMWPGEGEVLRDFPNGEPSIDGGCVVGPEKPRRVWAYRCEECVRRRNEWTNGGAWSFESGKAPGKWATYRIASGVTFRAPAGLVETSSGDGCLTTTDWTGEGMRIRADYGLSPHVPRFGRSDTNGAVFVGNTLADVHIWNDAPGRLRLVAGFWAPPAGDRELVLSVEVDNEKASKTANEIVGSVRFVGE